MSSSTLTGNAATIAAFLKQHGLTDAQVAGILGNWKVESNFQPDGTPGDGGLARGIAQWHPDRRPPGGLPRDLQGQLDWFWTEAHSSESAAFNKFLANSSNPGQAAAAFDQFYERSDGTARALRIEDADAYYPEVSGKVLDNNASGSGSVIGAPIGAAKTAVEGTFGAFKDVAAFLSWFGDKNHLLRVGYFVVGAVLVIVGGAKLIGVAPPAIGFGSAHSGGVVGKAVPKATLADVKG